MGTNVETPEEWMRGSCTARKRRVGANSAMIYLFLHGGVQLLKYYLRRDEGITDIIIAPFGP